MGLEELKEKVRQDFEKDIQDVKDEAQKDVDAIQAEVEEQSKENVQKMLDQAKRQADIAYKSMVSDAKTGFDRKILTKKDEAIESILAEVADRVPSWDDDSKRAIMSNLVKDMSRLGSNPTIKVSPYYAYLLPQNINANVVEEDIKDFGVIMYSEDGRAQIDNRLRQSLNGKRNTLKGYISKIVFG